jgi:hypothetical protein
LRLASYSSLRYIHVAVYLWLTGPDSESALFVSDLQDKTENNFFFQIIFAYYFLKINLQSFFKDNKS